VSREAIGGKYPNKRAYPEKEGEGKPARLSVPGRKKRTRLIGNCLKGMVVLKKKKKGKKTQSMLQQRRRNCLKIQKIQSAAEIKCTPRGARDRSRCENAFEYEKKNAVPDRLWRGAEYVNEEGKGGNKC